MKNKIEIQILSAATRQQLIQLRDEIRKIEGLEAFDLQIPPAPLSQGKMGGEFDLLGTICFAVIGGVIHYTSEKTVEQFHKNIGPLFKKILGRKKPGSRPEGQTMSGTGPAQSEDWKVAIAGDLNDSRSITYFEENGEINTFSNREYSIDPEHTHALLIGVSEYDDRANFSPIPPVAGNLDGMYRMLSDKRLVGLPFGNITRLYNENCIRIKDELRNISRAKDIKTLLIYYSGHGQNTGNNQLSLIARDTRNIDEELHNDIPYSFIEKMNTSSPAEQKIIFIDACHSGLAAQGSNSNVFDFEPVLGTFTLASTSAEEASYFKRDAANTYFTSSLLEVFKEGIKNANTMISLNDLYEYTSEKLAKIHLPAPVCKAQLKNIVANKFYISGNPSFSLEARLGKPMQLYQLGKYEEARREYILLEKEYPDNEALRNEHLEFERNVEFNKLVKEGDILFFGKKNFRAAQSKYREALTLKDDEGIRNKLVDCTNNIPDMPLVAKEEKRKPLVKNSSLQKRTLPLTKRQKMILFIAAGVTIITMLIIKFVWNNQARQSRQTEPISFDTAILKKSIPAPITIIKPKNDTAQLKIEDIFKISPDSQATKVMHLEGLVNSNGIKFSYSGETVNNKPDGKGTAVYENFGSETATYTGHWSNGKRDGFGTTNYTDGRHYEGYYKNDLREGRGTFTNKGGSKYEGEWVAGLEDGEGTSSINSFFDLPNLPDCKKYIGSWKAGLKDGYGKCYNSSGKLIYEGYFLNDKPVSHYPSR